MATVHFTYMRVLNAKVTGSLTSTSYVLANQYVTDTSSRATNCGNVDPGLDGEYGIVSVSSSIDSAISGFNIYSKATSYGDGLKVRFQKETSSNTWTTVEDFTLTSSVTTSAVSGTTAEIAAMLSCSRLRLIVAAVNGSNPPTDPEVALVLVQAVAEV